MRWLIILVFALSSCASASKFGESVEVSQGENILYVQSTHSTYHGSGETIDYIGTFSFNKESDFVSFTGGPPAGTRNGRQAFQIEKFWTGIVEKLIRSKDKAYVFHIRERTGEEKIVKLWIYDHGRNINGVTNYSAKFQVISGYHIVSYINCIFYTSK